MLTCAGFSDSAVLQHYLEERIKERAKKHGEFIFGAHRHHHGNLATETKCVMKTMRTVEVKPTPHRFRHTFARIILQRGGLCQGCCRLIGEFRADGSRALRCLDSGKTGEANKDSAGSFYGRAKTKSHQHA
jgi:hypothetical protein